MRDYGKVPYGLEVINLGSTFSNAGFDYKYFGKKGFNFASAPQPLKVDYEVLETYQNHLVENAIVIVALVCPFVFSLYDYSELKVPIRKRMKKFFKKHIRKVTHYDPVKKREKEQQKYSLNELASIYSVKRVKAWKSEFYLKDTISQLPTQELKYTFSRTCEELSKILRLCEQKHFQPVIISMPMVREESSLFSKEFIKAFFDDNVNHVVNGKYPIIEYFYDERFHDVTLYENYSDRLNDKGRQLFANILVEDLKRLEVWKGSDYHGT